MIFAFFLISAAFCAAVFIADIDSSSKFDEYPLIDEGNRRFRDKTGDTDIRKLIIFKAVLFAGTATIALFLLLFAEAGFYAGFVFWLMSAVEILTVISNYRKIAKNRAALSREKAERAIPASIPKTDSPIQPGDLR